VDEAPDRWWLGLVVPRRHARRAVTRTLVKRQMRAQMLGAVAACACGAKLPMGLWVLRLRAPFERAQFPSAASTALRHALRSELALLLEGAAARALPRHCDR
jgi:ribonuclease P protein component